MSLCIDFGQVCNCWDIDLTFSVRTVGKAVLEPSKKEEESGSTSFIEVENLHRLH